ncbi:MAG TPA: hypothetical protein ENN92_00955 [candidate division WWE3 bacterium]|uniref:Uncharacterized protein n=1 Tax=candidate division WWE3 bacterium TaxID=2053526 RepID=A0A7C1HYV3_UNCKA|nr:hypothetical protein [candidate division WWE3 bacterium]
MKKKEESENFQQVKNKFGIFATARNKKSFELFLNEQKQALIQEYKVVEGKNPTNLLESKVIMGNKEGVKLTNYAWWGTVIFVDHSDVDAFLVFVIPNGVSKEFEGVINTILNSVKFLQKE